jgi:hypothetical protein
MNELVFPYFLWGGAGGGGATREMLCEDPLCPEFPS